MQRNRNTLVVVYPDSGTVWVALTDELYRKSATAEYWECEETWTGKN